MAHGCEGIKPGWVRVNFNYFISDTVADYVIEAVRRVARDGWRLMGEYRFDPASGRWRHRDGLVEPPVRLRDIGFGADGTLRMPSVTPTGGEEMLAAHLAEGDALLAAAATPDSDRQPLAALSDDFEHLRWFDLPAESVAATPAR